MVSSALTELCNHHLSLVSEHSDKEAPPLSAVTPTPALPLTPADPHSLSLWVCLFWTLYLHGALQYTNPCSFDSKLWEHTGAGLFRNNVSLSSSSSRWEKSQVQRGTCSAPRMVRHLLLLFPGKGFVGPAGQGSPLVPGAVTRGVEPHQRTGWGEGTKTPEGGAWPDLDPSIPLPSFPVPLGVAKLCLRPHAPPTRPGSGVCGERATRVGPSLKPSGRARALGEARQRLGFLPEDEGRGAGGVGVWSPEIFACFVSVDVCRREASGAGGDCELEFPGGTSRAPRHWQGGGASTPGNVLEEL